MTWALLAWVALTVLFIVGINTWANNDVREECVGGTFECDTAISIASGVWTAIGVVVGFLGFFALGLIWLMTRPRRHCPACGRDAKKGWTVCQEVRVRLRPVSHCLTDSAGTAPSANTATSAESLTRSSPRIDPTRLTEPGIR